MKHSIINNDFVKALFSVQEENISQPHILQHRNSKIYNLYYVCVKQRSLTIAHYLQGNLAFSNIKFLFPFISQLWHGYFEIKVEKCFVKN